MDATPDIKLQTDQLFTKWAEFTVQRLREALDKFRRPTWTDGLYNSINTELRRANGDVDAVILKFRQYGRFVDMGVGRGVPIGSAGTGAFSAARNANGTLKQYARRPEKWFSKTYYGEVQKIKELYIEMFNNEVPLAISDALSQTITLAA